MLSSSLQTVEIRQNRSKMSLMLGALITIVIVVTYLIYFSGKVNNNVTKVVDAFLTLYILFIIYGLAKRLAKNVPELIFTRSGIEINENGKSTSFSWIQITAWSVDKIENTHYLMLEAADQKKKINIAWLEKKPAEIEELMREYKRETT